MPEVLIPIKIKRNLMMKIKTIIIIEKSRFDRRYLDLHMSSQI